MKKKQMPAKKSRPATKPRVQSERLKGWNEIASFLGQPVAMAQRWSRSGMPVTREGRFMYASREELSGYLGREGGLDVKRSSVERFDGGEPAGSTIICSRTLSR